MYESISMFRNIRAAPKKEMGATSEFPLYSNTKQERICVEKRRSWNDSEADAPRCTFAFWLHLPEAALKCCFSIRTHSTRFRNSFWKLRERELRTAALFRVGGRFFAFAKVWNSPIGQYCKKANRRQRQRQQQWQRQRQPQPQRFFFFFLTIITFLLSNPLFLGFYRWTIGFLNAFLHSATNVPSSRLLTKFLKGLPFCTNRG